MAEQRLQQIYGHLNYPKGMLPGQTCIITGSGQGIGAEAARLFANEGAKVVVSDIDGKKAKDVAAAINSSGGKALDVPGDMLDDEYVEKLVKEAANFGGGKIHVIVNNAGFTWDGVIHKMTSKQCMSYSRFHSISGPPPRSAFPTKVFRTDTNSGDTIISLHATARTFHDAI